jgi:DNA-binding HxlR family transcriptional regulator
VAGRRSCNQDCPIANGLDVRGESWTLLIVRELVRVRAAIATCVRSCRASRQTFWLNTFDELEDTGVVELTELPNTSGSVPGSSAENTLTKQPAHCVTRMQAEGTHKVSRVEP